MQFVDFDGVRFHLSTPEKKTVILLSMNIRCWPELVQAGAREILKREYGSYVSNTVEPEYNVTLEIDLDHIPPEGGMSSYELVDGGLLLMKVPGTRGSRCVDQITFAAQAKCSCRAF